MAAYCDVCYIDFVDEHAYQGHLTGKKHNNNLKQVQIKKRITETSIFVSNLPPFFTPHNLIDFFQQYGQIANHTLGKDYALIQFSDREPVEFLLSRPIWVNNCKLNIKRRILHEFNPRRDYNNAKKDEEEASNELSYKHFKNIFKVQTTFDSQLIAFLNAIQQSEVIVEGIYGSVCESLNQIFKTRFPNCKAHRFGSTVTGLGFKKCDLDVFMDVGVPINENEETADPQEWTPKRVFNVAKKLMFQRKIIFTRIVLIPRAKTPIIKFCHAPTAIFCDITFKNSLGVHNSHLIKHYLSLDVRLKPLMVIIKYWAQLFEISGMGKISNYALVMLIIFYLQQLENVVIPSIMELQSSCSPQLVDDWQVNFDKNVTIREIPNENTIPEFLLGFFECYSAFPFDSKVICPLDGIAYPKTVFTGTNRIPDSMFRYKEYISKKENPIHLNTDKPMCVQDPIELSHNLTSGISTKAVESFRKHCEISATVCREAMKADCLNLFSRLFTERPKMGKNLSFKATIRVGQVLKAGLPADFYSRTDIVDRDQYILENWYETVFNLVKEFLEKVLKLEVKPASSEREAKQQKCDAQSDVHSKDNEKIIFNCTGIYKLWCGRKSKKAVFDPSMSMLEKEAGISEKLMEQMKKIGNKSVPLIDFVCILEKHQNPISVQLSMVDKNCTKNLFKEISSYIASKMPHIIDKTMWHMLQYKNK